MPGCCSSSVPSIGDTSEVTCVDLGQPSIPECISQQPATSTGKEKSYNFWIKTGLFIFESSGVLRIFATTKEITEFYILQWYRFIYNNAVTFKLLRTRKGTLQEMYIYNIFTHKHYINNNKSIYFYSYSLLTNENVKQHEVNIGRHDKRTCWYYCIAYWSKIFHMCSSGLSMHPHISVI